MPRQYKLARKMKKITLTNAAKDLGVTQPTLSGWESERKNPTIDNLIRMSEYYGVTVDFLLGLTSENDPRMDMLQPVQQETLPAYHATPVYSSERGWAFVDAIEKHLRFADGSNLPLMDAKEVFVVPPPFAVSEYPRSKPLPRSVLAEYERVWLEPISHDNALREELRGWYSVRQRFVENEFGQKFYFDTYNAKWLAFSSEE